MTDFRQFKPGEKVSVLQDRIASWMKPGQLFEIAEVHDHGRFIKEVGHTQSLIMTDGEVFSAWWFDKNCKMLETRKGVS